MCMLLFQACLPPAASAQPSSSIVALIRQGKTEQAKKMLAGMDTKNYTPDLLLFLKGLLSSNGEEAARYYNDIVKNYSSSPYCDDALLRLAQYQYARGLYKQAARAFAGISAAYPNSNLLPKCFFWEGLSLLSFGMNDSAAARLTSVINRFPDSDMADPARKHLAVLMQDEAEDAGTGNSPQSLDYSIQVGAFSIQQNAILRKSFFEGKGYKVELRTKEKAGTTFYLVWIGAFATRDEAHRFGRQLKQKFGLTYTLVQR